MINMVQLALVRDFTLWLSPVDILARGAFKFHEKFHNHKLHNHDHNHKLHNHKHKLHNHDHNHNHNHDNINLY